MEEILKEAGVTVLHHYVETKYKKVDACYKFSPISESVLRNKSQNTTAFE